MVNCFQNVLKHTNKTTLKYVTLTIGVYAEHLKSIYLTTYVFKFHLQKLNKLDIYHIKSDQKVLCKTKLVEKKYRCLYALIIDILNINNKLMIYPITDNIKYNMYAEFVNATYIEENNETELIKLIPNNHSTYNYLNYPL